MRGKYIFYPLSRDQWNLTQMCDTRWRRSQVLERSKFTAGGRGWSGRRCCDGRLSGITFRILFAVHSQNPTNQQENTHQSNDVRGPPAARMKCLKLMDSRISSAIWGGYWYHRVC